MTTDFSFIAAGDITASLVVDERGNTKNASGNSKGLGNQTDLNFLLWLRARSQIVLTSGITAEAEDYAYPSSAELAILTRSNRTYPRLADSLNRVRFISAASFAEAIASLQSEGLRRIHTEFGETGFLSLVGDNIDCFVSSRVQAGIQHFLRRTGLQALETFDLSDLQIARVAGRGRD